MTDMREFFAMGGYAFFVWTSFGAALLLIGGVSLYAARELKRVRRDTFRGALARTRREPRVSTAATAPGGDVPNGGVPSGSLR